VRFRDASKCLLQHGYELGGINTNVPLALTVLLAGVQDWGDQDE
jgi:hypothetical protein